MKSRKVLLGGLLMLLGLVGIASLLTMEIPLPAEAEAMLNERFTPGQIKLLLLINPTLFLLIAVSIGTVLYRKAGLGVPILEHAMGAAPRPDVGRILTYGVVGGLATGVLLTLIGVLFDPVLPVEFKEFGASLRPTLATRFLYGGFTEEIMMRYGLMTLVVWLCSLLLGGTRPVVYWVGIAVAALIFAVGHFPIATQAVEHPTTALYAYILIGNSLGGVIFGWLYWKKGLESAFIAHICAHVVMVLAEPMLNA